MPPTLSTNEIRALGCLIEKSVTTPDVYPLSLNALTTACNQKSNREPVLQLSETDVQSAIDSLVEKTLARPDRGSSRVARYAHRVDDRLFGELAFSGEELAVICLLLLRGPQTAGELRSRSNRLFAFSGIEQVEAVLDGLSTRDDGPYVVALAREPGRREIRHRHCFSDPAERTEAPTAAPVESRADQEAATGSLSERVKALEARVEELSALVDELINQSD
ncbi:MAG: YceH family protein [Pseudomonadota bacterium]